MSSQQTDDKGVFSTTLSEEYSIMARTFNLTEEQVWNLSFRSIDYIFEGDAVKNDLKELWKTEKEKLMSVKTKSAIKFLFTTGTET